MSGDRTYNTQVGFSLACSHPKELHSKYNLKKSMPLRSSYERLLLCLKILEVALISIIIQS